MSEPQRKFMGMCAHTDHPPARCPSRKVAREFSHKPRKGMILHGEKKR